MLKYRTEMHYETPAGQSNSSLCGQQCLRHLPTCGLAGTGSNPTHRHRYSPGTSSMAIDLGRSFDMLIW